MKRRLVVLGLDGFSAELLKKQKDVLPFLWRIASRYSLNTLKSTFVPTTGPAWTSFQTGMDLEKHKVLGFLKYNERRDSRLVNSNDIKEEPIYSYLHSKGKRVMVMNLPFTFPPKIKGDVITSWLTPRTDIREFLNPRQLVSRYKTAKRLRIIPPQKVEKLAFLNETEKILDSKIEFIEEVMEKEEHDFYFFLISETDWIQHKIFVDLVSSGQKLSEEVRQARKILRKVDNVVKTIVSKDENTDFIIMSDHGFQVYDKRFNVNDWLEKEGYLVCELNSSDTLRGKRKEGLIKLIRRNNVLFQFLLRIYRFFNRRFGFHVRTNWRIDFNKSMAFCPSSDQLVIQVKNVRARKEIADKLISLGFFIKEVAWYPGLLFFSNIYLVSSKFCGTLFVNERKGWHNYDGILISNLNMRNGFIVDMYPTICEIMGLKVREGLDGISLLL